MAWSDQNVIAELISTAPLMSEKEWDNSTNPQDSMRLYLYMAHASLVADRHMKEAIIPLLERAGYGDLSETMRTLRNVLIETVDGDVEQLIAPCLIAVTLPQPGCRMWALDTLEMFLDKPEVRSVFEQALNDKEAGIRESAKIALESFEDSKEGYPRSIS
ncbi:hypothetical protein ACFSUS_19915 [Spirosoma soli]|uniref:HEAT repeat domain-containing protein n=1 Tax=Spirosoma soli TaxID=1770529 RepID=A0ABW5M8C7_9BACT